MCRIGDSGHAAFLTGKAVPAARGGCLPGSRSPAIFFRVGREAQQNLPCMGEPRRLIGDVDLISLSHVDAGCFCTIVLS